MINFIIVEDDKSYVDRYKRIIDTIMFKNDNKYQIIIYDKYSLKLSNNIKHPTNFNIYILDIEIKGEKSGLEVAQEIRENDWDSEIIFITNHDKMFEPVFRTIYKVFDFIEKFHKCDVRLEEDLNKIISKGFDTKKFLYINNRNDLQIYLKDIYYIYRDTTERKIVIVTSKNKFTVGLSITETIQMLDERFKQTHRACIVNNDYVNLYNWNEGYFVLKSGKRVDLCSKNYKKEQNQ